MNSNTQFNGVAKNSSIPIRVSQSYRKVYTSFTIQWLLINPTPTTTSKLLKMLSNLCMTMQTEYRTIISFMCIEKYVENKIFQVTKWKEKKSLVSSK